MADSGDSGAGGASEGFTNRVALTVAILASFAALSTIRSGNVAQEIDLARAEVNNSWAWYQAVRVREDMATYELANLERLARALPAAAQPAPEAQAFGAEIAAQHEEVARVRARKDEVEARAHAAEAALTRLSVFDDQFDLSEALVTIAVTLLAVAVLARTRWLYWFALLPSAAGIALGAAAMLSQPLNFETLAAAAAGLLK